MGNLKQNRQGKGVQLGHLGCSWGTEAWGKAHYQGMRSSWGGGDQELGPGAGAQALSVQCARLLQRQLGKACSDGLLPARLAHAPDRLS